MKIFVRLFYALGFFFFYLGKLVQSNMVIAYDILSPNLSSNPGFVQVPVTLQSDAGMLLFSNLVSMTPGTLTTDISSDKQFFEIHVLYMKESEKEIIDEMMRMQQKIKKFVP